MTRATPRLVEAASATLSGRPQADQAFQLGLDTLITGLTTPSAKRATTDDAWLDEPDDHKVEYHMPLLTRFHE